MSSDGGQVQSGGRSKQEDEADAAAPAAATEDTKAVLDDVDDLLDEIDDVLEENAEEFVKNYVQKGGE